MAAMTVFSLLESPAHPNFSSLYQRLGLHEIKLNSNRKAISQLKQTRPDYVVAEFFYGFGNNYAGVNISNLDVFLYSLQKYAPDARVIVLVQKPDAQHVSKLTELFPIHAVLQQPAQEQEMEAALNALP